VAATRAEDVQRAVARRTPARLSEPVASHAAVAMVLREAPVGLELLFIRRAEHPADPWSGQIAFPGGRAEREDRDLQDTAIRETREEIGLDLAEHGQALGSLDEQRAMARRRPMNLTITPFVFLLALAAFEPTLSSEVIGVHWLPFDELVDGRWRATHRLQQDAKTLEFPCLRYAGLTIWGLTYRMFCDLADAIRDAREAEPGA